MLVIAFLTVEEPIAIGTIHPSNELTGRGAETTRAFVITKMSFCMIVTFVTLFTPIICFKESCHGTDDNVVVVVMEQMQHFLFLRSLEPEGAVLDLGPNFDLIVGKDFLQFLQFN